MSATTRRRLCFALLFVHLVTALVPCRALLHALSLRGGNATSAADPQHLLSNSQVDSDVLVTDSFVDKMLWDDDGIFENNAEGGDGPLPSPLLTFSSPSAQQRNQTPPAASSTSGSSVIVSSTRRRMLLSETMPSPPSPAMATVPDVSVGARATRAVRFFGTPVSSFKGFGLSLDKSVMKMAACGLAVKIPITAHFPEYDKNQNYPRLSGSVGITYPKGYKVSMSANFNMQTALVKVLAVCDAAGVNGAGTWLEQMRRQQASASVKRVGATFSLRYTETEKFTFTVEPWVSYIPGLDVMKQYVLPVLLVLPAAAVAALGAVLPLPMEEEVEERRAGDQAGDVRSRVAAQVAAPANSTKGGSRAAKRKKTPVSAEPGPAAASGRPEDSGAVQAAPISLRNTGPDGSPPISKKSARKKRTTRYARGRSVRHWHRQLMSWAVTKTCWLGMDFGSRYRSLFDASKSSRVYFEVAPFFPLAKTMKRTQAWLSGRPSQWRVQLWRWLRFARGLPPEPEPEPDVQEANEGAGGGEERSWHEDVEWLPEITRLGGMRGVDEAAAQQAPIAVPAQAAAGTAPSAVARPI